MTPEILYLAQLGITTSVAYGPDSDESVSAFYSVVCIGPRGQMSPVQKAGDLEQAGQIAFAESVRLGWIAADARFSCPMCATPIAACACPKSGKVH